MQKFIKNLSEKKWREYTRKLEQKEQPQEQIEKQKTPETLVNKRLKVILIVNDTEKDIAIETKAQKTFEINLDTPNKKLEVKNLVLISTDTDANQAPVTIPAQETTVTWRLGEAKITGAIFDPTPEIINQAKLEKGNEYTLVVRVKANNIDASKQTQWIVAIK